MKKPAPAPTGTGSDLRRDTLSTKHIVSSSEQTYNQNICVSVIFVPKNSTLKTLYLLNP